MNRATMLHNLDAIMKHAAASRDSAKQATGDLFGNAMPEDALRIVEVPEWDEMTKLWHEQAALGAPISGHPVSLLRRDSQRADDRLSGLRNLTEIADATPVSLLAMVTDVWVRTSSRGNRFAIVTLSDETGNGEVVFYDEALEQSRAFLRENAIVLLRCKVSRKDTRSSIVVDTARFVAQFGPRG